MSGFRFVILLIFLSSGVLATQAHGSEKRFSLTPQWLPPKKHFADQDAYLGFKPGNPLHEASQLDGRKVDPDAEIELERQQELEKRGLNIMPSKTRDPYHFATNHPVHEKPTVAGSFTFQWPH